MGATAFLPVCNCQRPIRARMAISGQPASKAPQPATAAPSGHEKGTKRVRKGHGLGMVFPTLEIATIVFDSTCAVEKNLFSAPAPSEPSCRRRITKRTQSAIRNPHGTGGPTRTSPGPTRDLFFKNSLLHPLPNRWHSHHFRVPGACINTRAFHSYLFVPFMAISSAKRTQQSHDPQTRS